MSESSHWLKDRIGSDWTGPDMSMHTFGMLFVFQFQTRVATRHHCLEGSMEEREEATNLLRKEDIQQEAKQ